MFDEIFKVFDTNLDLDPKSESDSDPYSDPDSAEYLGNTNL
jgi:hypothetical protein